MPFFSDKTKLDKKKHIVCIAGEHKGNDFFEECREADRRVKKPKHVGLIFCSNKHERVSQLMKFYVGKKSQDFFAVAPVK
ncbi:MAG: hypothetical protein ACR2L1_10610 [Pyrinomonadaceae bacterium]